MFNVEKLNETMFHSKIGKERSVLRPYVLTVIIMLTILVGCQADAPEQTSLVVTVNDGGVIRTYQQPNSLTVEEFLVEAEYEWDDNDRVAPPLYTQVVDGTRITIVRIEEEEVCQEEDIPYDVERRPSEAFEPGEVIRQQSGRNGQQRVCYRVIRENGVEQDRIPMRQPEVIVEPVNEILIVGIDREVEPIRLPGTLAYINNGAAWVIKERSQNKRPVTTFTDLDSLVYALSPDGSYLLFSRQPSDPEAFINELWLIETSGQRDPVSLNVTDVLSAEWLPNERDTFSFSTGEVQEALPGWRALNNVWVQRVDPQTGNALSIRRVVDETVGGLYSWWGTVYEWSPDGETLAWVEADGAGIYDEDEQVRLVDYTVFAVLSNWSWRSNISWSWDGTLLATTVHGDPIANEPPETTPVFDIAVVDVGGNFEATILERVGMWASPQFSPPINDPESEFQTGYLAYLKARNPDNSVYGEYDLVVADRDGSNSRIVFPPPGQAGITRTDVGIAPVEYTWSPDGRWIGVIYQGNLWVINVESEIAYQMTFDGGAENPVWSA